MYEVPPDNISDSKAHGLRQLLRYGLVGVLNVSIDFTITNLLVILSGASGPGSLFIISLISCLVATLNGYRINKAWTFKDSHATLPPYAMAKYAGVALLAMMINTSVFLYVYQFLYAEFDISRLVGINIAKLAAVATASVFAFLGYRISVFRPAVVESFRENFRFQTSTQVFSLFSQLGVLLVTSITARLFYLSLTTAIYGNAVNYGLIAEAIANGQWALAQSGWTNLFCFWESLFYMAGLKPVTSAICASFIPGALLVVPIAWSTRKLYGEKVAWLAGGLTVLHPRLVAYSCNGYSETFYLFALCSGVAILSASGWRIAMNRHLFLSGIALAVYFCVRNEGIVLITVLMVGMIFLGQRAQRPSYLQESTWVTQTFRSLALVLAGLCVFVGFYAGFSEAVFGEVDLFQDTSLFSQRYSEQLDPQSAARETYGIEGRMTSKTVKEIDFGQKLKNLFVRLPSNLLHTLKSAPGVLLTPMCFFAFFLPLFSRSRNGTLLPEWPWLVMLFFPFVTYPLLYIEPRLLFAILPPIHIFGAAGLLAFSTFLVETNYFRYLYKITAIFVLALCVIITIFRGVQVESGYGYNRALAAWIDKNIPPNDVIVGDGYGFVSTTGFLARRATVNRLIHYDPKRVVEFVKSHHAKWLVLYEPFVLRVNPELAPVFDRGLPGMQLAYQTTDDRRRRIQVYRLKDYGSEVFDSPQPILDPDCYQNLPHKSLNLNSDA